MQCLKIIYGTIVTSLVLVKGIYFSQMESGIDLCEMSFMHSNGPSVGFSPGSGSCKDSSLVSANSSYSQT